MPPKSKRRFDKKGSHRFVVMHRSHLDPLYDVPGASKMVLQPSTDNPDTEDFLIAMQESLDAEATAKLKKLKEANESGKPIDAAILDAVNEYGFANDGYDYSQHTKEMGEGAFVSASGNVLSAKEVVIPGNNHNGVSLEQDALLATTSITASMEENERQFESIALSTDDMPGDVADALNGGEGFFELNDDFVIEASKRPSTPDAQVFDFDAHIKRLMRHADGIYSDDEEEEDVDFDVNEVLNGEGNDTEKRIDRLQDLQFDAFLEHDYQDDTIGDLEDKITIEGLAEQINGVTLAPGTYFEDIIDNYLENDGNQEYDDGHDNKNSNVTKTQNGNNIISDMEDIDDDGAGLRDVMVTVQMEQNIQDVEAMKKVAEKVKMTGDNKVLVEDAWINNPRDAVPRRLQQKWDVESITSTYSNTDNHPQVLRDNTMKPRKNKLKEKLIKLSKKTGMPILEEEDDEDYNSEEEEEVLLTRVNKGVARNKKETKEEKKARKQALKEAKKARRQEKKTVKLVYKEETSKQLKAGVGNDTRSIYRIK
jgi:protein LTV1